MRPGFETIFWQHAGNAQKGSHSIHESFLSAPNSSKGKKGSVGRFGAGDEKKKKRIENVGISCFSPLNLLLRHRPFVLRQTFLENGPSVTQPPLLPSLPLPPRPDGPGYQILSLVLFQGDMENRLQSQ